MEALDAAIDKLMKQTRDRENHEDVVHQMMNRAFRVDEARKRARTMEDVEYIDGVEQTATAKDYARVEEMAKAEIEDQLIKQAMSESMDTLTMDNLLARMGLCEWADTTKPPPEEAPFGVALFTDRRMATLVTMAAAADANRWASGVWTVMHKDNKLPLGHWRAICNDCVNQGGLLRICPVIERSCLWQGREAWVRMYMKVTP